MQIIRRKSFKALLSTLVISLILVSPLFVAKSATSGMTYDSARAKFGEELLILGLDSRSEIDKGLPDSITILNIKTHKTKSISREWTYSLLEPRETLVSKYLGLNECEPFCNIQGVFAYSQTSSLGDDLRVEAVETLRKVVSAELELSNLSVIAFDLSRARSFLNLVGSVKINVKKTVPTGGQVVDGKLTNFSDSIKPGVQNLQGEKLFWFARSRAMSDNQERMGRQRQLIGALLNQKKPTELVRAAFNSEGFAITDLKSTEIIEIYLGML